MSDLVDQPDTWDVAFTEVYRRTHEAHWTVEESAEQARQAMRLAGASPPARVLDCPCGFGRHTQALADAGYHVTGVDRSLAQLTEAQQRRPPGADHAIYQRADYRQLPFPDHSFDVVACLWSSLGYLDRAGDQQVLTEFHRVLRPGGTLVLELAHRDAYFATYIPRTWDRLDDGGLYLKERRFDPRTGVVATDHTLIETDGRVANWATDHRFSTITEWDDFLRLAGFREIAVHAGLTAHPIDQNPRERAVFVAR
jgi:ubiquinone/menaquinone biosynthesis C-methylase UbiE